MKCRWLMGMRLQILFLQKRRGWEQNRSIVKWCFTWVLTCKIVRGCAPTFECLAQRQELSLVFLIETWSPVPSFLWKPGIRIWQKQGQGSWFGVFYFPSPKWRKYDWVTKDAWRQTEFGWNFGKAKRVVFFSWIWWMEIWKGEGSSNKGM